MNIMRSKLKVIGIMIGMMLLMLSNTANAATIDCLNTANNYMQMDSSEASACVAAGLGNINQNPATDDFLLSGGTAGGYVGAGVAATYTTDGTEFGTWSIASAVDAIGFKFGTGNTPDEWFIFDLVAGVTSGNWTFIDVLAPGAGGDRISHMETYNKGTPPPPPPVSEPATLAFLAFGLIGLGLARRRKAA